MNDLKNRALVFFLGVPYVLGMVYLGGWYFTVSFAFISLMGARELIRIGKQLSVQSSPYPAMLFTAVLPVIAYLFGLGQVLFAAVVMVLLLAIIALRKDPKAGFPNLMLNVFAVVYLGVLFSVVVLLRHAPVFVTDRDAADFFMYILICFWLADSSAYFIGSRFGKRPLAKLLSPNKTIEGTVAEMVAAVLWSVFATLPPDGLLTIFDRIVIGIIVGSMAVIGDLTESMMKRAVGVKDSGRFFPGHGGMLDRFDSMLFVMPSVYIYLVLVGDVKL